MNKKFECKNETWIVGNKIGSGGFGSVYEARSDTHDNVAIKFIPKDPGADRELLFADTDGAENVIQIIDRGESDTDWIIVMPRAEKSLAEHIADTENTLNLEETISVLTDIVTALVSIDGRIVHRDLKPANILLLDGVWCLADFGISRYAEATTAEDTKKFALTAAYAAPERWRSERATTATDIYSLGVIMYELIAGTLPFVGSSIEELREQHLHVDAPDIENASAAAQTLIEECLFKAPEARPKPDNFLARLTRIKKVKPSKAFAALQGANQQVIKAQAETARIASEKRTAEEKRLALFQAATKSLDRIYAEISELIQDGAPATLVNKQPDLIGHKLNDAYLSLVSAAPADNDWGKYGAPKIDVVACAEVNLQVPRDRYDYGGRSHSLWYCDAKVAGEYGWYETAFMLNPLVSQRAVQDPFSLTKGEDSAQALLPITAKFQLAWPVERVSPDNMDEFIERWVEWFAKAANGDLSRSSRMPERDIHAGQNFR